MQLAKLPREEVMSRTKKDRIVETVQNAIGNGVTMTITQWAESLGVSASYTQAVIRTCDLKRGLTRQAGPCFQPMSVKVNDSPRIPKRITRAAGFVNGQILIARAIPGKITLIAR